MQQNTSEWQPFKNLVGASKTKDMTMLQNAYTKYYEARHALCESITIKAFPISKPGKRKLLDKINSSKNPSEVFDTVDSEDVIRNTITNHCGGISQILMYARVEEDVEIDNKGTRSPKRKRPEYTITRWLSDAYASSRHDSVLAAFYKHIFKALGARLNDCRVSGVKHNGCVGYLPERADGYQLIEVSWKQ